MEEYENDENYIERNNVGIKVGAIGIVVGAVFGLIAFEVDMVLIALTPFVVGFVTSMLYPLDEGGGEAGAIAAAILLGAIAILWLIIVIGESGDSISSQIVIDLLVV